MWDMSNFHVTMWNYLTKGLMFLVPGALPENSPRQVQQSAFAYMGEKKLILSN